MPGALEQARAHHHVAARRGQAVQQHDRRARRRPARRRARPRPSVTTCSSLAGAGPQACTAACARTSSAERSGRSQKNRWPTPSKISSRESGYQRRRSGAPFCTGQHLIERCRGRRASASSARTGARWCRVRRSPASGAMITATGTARASRSRESARTASRRRRSSGETLPPRRRASPARGRRTIRLGQPLHHRFAEASALPSPPQ